MHSTKSLFIVLFAFVAMAAVGGYFTGKITTKPTIIETTAEALPKTSTASAVTSSEDLLKLNRVLSENEKLHREIERLKASIAQEETLLEEMDPMVAEAPAPAVEAAPQEMRRLSMEDIKAQDPERYERMMTNLQQHQNRMREMRQQRMEFLTGVDTTLLTVEEQQVHTAYLQALSTRAAAEEAIWEKQMAGESLEEEDFAAMREAAFAVRDLQAAETTALLNAVGTMYNISEENLEGFVNTVNEVNAVLGGGMRMGPPRGGPGRR